MGTDETGYAVVAALNGMLYVLALGGRTGTGYSDENLEFYAQVAKDYNVTNVVIESNFGDGIFTKVLEPVLNRLHPCSIVEERHNTQKELRIISTLEPVLNQHRLVIDPKVIEQDYESVSHLPVERALEYMFTYQLTRLTKDKGSLAHDDRIDALAMAVKWWQNTLNLDAESIFTKEAEKERDAYLLKHQATLHGHFDVKSVKVDVVSGRVTYLGKTIYQEKLKNDKSLTTFLNKTDKRVSLSSSRNNSWGSRRK